MNAMKEMLKKKLSNENVKRHLLKKYSKLISKSIFLFNKKEQEFVPKQNLMRKTATGVKNITAISYDV